MTEPSPGQLLAARFELLRLLGRGGMGQVWLARDAELGGDLALKILEPRLFADGSMIDLMRHECRQARRLLHPGIVRVFDFHQADGLAFISMEYVDGGELGQLRDAAPAEILMPLVPLTDALAYAHAQGVIHRDLKPSNVLLEPGGQPRLLDFGIAAALDASAGLRITGGGSRVSSSPEQRAGLPPSPADDAFAMGVLIHELISGFPPELAEGKEPPPLRSRMNFEVPDALQELVGGLLVWEARSRLSDMEQIGRQLDSVLQSCRGYTVPPRVQAVARASVAPGPIEVSTTAPRQGPAPVEAPSSRTMVWIWAAFAVLLALLAAVVFVLPKQVAKQPPSIAQETTAPAAAVTPDEDIEQLAASKKGADEARGSYLLRRQGLVDRGAEEWGASGLADAEAAADAAARAYQGAAYAQAQSGWEEAAKSLAALDLRGGELLAAARARGQAALVRGDRALAEQEFRLALKIDPEDEVARMGLERAPRIERVIQLMREGERLEASGRLRDAATVYRQAVELDPQMGEAADAVARVDAALVQRGFVEAMSSGYRALESGSYDAAVKAFNQAARIRPDAPEPGMGLSEARAAKTLSRVQGLAELAREKEQSEQWREAAEAYQQILAIDASVISATQGLQRTRSRAEIDDRLQAFLVDPELLYAVDGVERARAALADAGRVAEAGARLRAQMAALDALVRKATRPVQVMLESDNLTQVVVYRVGRLGSFERKLLQLEPGDYTVVGTRAGYRDVRRQLKLRPGNDPPPLSIRCEEPI